MALSALSDVAVTKISKALVGAKDPLIVTGYSGRHYSTVAALVDLTNVFKGLRVLDTGRSDMCFLADHWA